MISVEDLKIKGVKIVTPQIYVDERGYFMETWRQQEFDNVIGRHVEFVQECQSGSIRNVVRGLHFQLPPHEQAKLVRCTCGRIFDVAVDVRKTSSTFGQWVGAELSEENHKQLWIPEGFAHGFMVISDYAQVCYKVTDYWHKESESSVRWDDPRIKIKWPKADVIVSEKDKKALGLYEAIVFE